MTIFIKRLFYIINILTIIAVAFVISFSANSITGNYKNLSKLNYNIEKEYDAILDNYEEIIAYVLKNGLPKNKALLNSVSSVAYNLPPINELKFSESKDVIVNRA